MHVLFLDFDGVLHPGPGVASPLTRWCWLPTLAHLLAGHADVRLVIHSSWRHHHDGDELRELLGSLGERVIGVTKGEGRLQGIEQWLAEHPEVRSYRILDDDKGDFAHPHAPGLIVCDSARGVADPRVQSELLSWLTDRPPEQSV